MKITPVELRNLKFRTVMRGFDSKEVQTYIDAATEEIERLLLENKEYSEKLEHFSKIEDTIKETLITVQEATKKLKESAQKEAKVIIDGAKQKKKEIESEYASLVSKREVFLVEFKALLESYLSLVEKKLATETTEDTEKGILEDADKTVTEKEVPEDTEKETPEKIKE